MKALILAGGLGTRIKEIAKDNPKPLLDVAGEPFLDYLLRYLKKYGIDNVIFLLGYKNEKIIEYYKNYQGMNIEFSIELSPLGTAGAFKNAEEIINENEFLLLNGDSFANVNFKDFIEYARYKGGLGSIAVKCIKNTGDYGLVEIDSDNRILGFNEKRKKAQGLINLGVYYFNKDILGFIPKEKSFSLEKDLMPLLISKGQNVYVFQTDCFFIDIGTPERYKKAQELLRKVEI